MDKTSYISLQKKYPGKLVALSKKGLVVAFGKTTEVLEKELKKKKLNPRDCLFLGPVEQYNQISVY